MPQEMWASLRRSPPLPSKKESASVISSCPFFSVVRLSVFALCLYPFFRLYLPWYSSFLSKIVRLSLMGRWKKVANGVLAIFPCSRTGSTLRAENKGFDLRDEPSTIRGLAGRNFLNRPEASDRPRVCGPLCPSKFLLFNTPLMCDVELCWSCGYSFSPC